MTNSCVIFLPSLACKLASWIFQNPHFKFCTRRNGDEIIMTRFEFLLSIISIVDEKYFQLFIVQCQKKIGTYLEIVVLHFRRKMPFLRQRSRALTQFQVSKVFLQLIKPLPSRFFLIIILLLLFLSTAGAPESKGYPSTPSIRPTSCSKTP